MTFKNTKQFPKTFCNFHLWKTKHLTHVQLLQVSSLSKYKTKLNYKGNHSNDKTNEHCFKFKNHFLKQNPNNGYHLEAILSSKYTVRTSKHGTKSPDSNIRQANTNISLISTITPYRKLNYYSVNPLLKDHYY